MVLIIFLLLVCISCAIAKKSYQRLAVSSARSEHSLPAQLDKVLKHISFVNILLDTILLSALALSVIAISFEFEIVWGFIIIFLSLLIIFIVIPNIKPSPVSANLTKLTAKPLAFLIIKSEPLVDRLEMTLSKANERFYSPQPISKKALSGILKEQVDIANDELKSDLKLAISSLDLNSDKAGQHMVKRHKTRIVSADEPVGPILLSELHDTGRKVFPVEDKDSQITGTLELERLTKLRSGGNVAKAVNDRLVNIDKDAPLTRMMKIFIEDGTALAVVEEHGKAVGFLYLEDVLKALDLE